MVAVIRRRGEVGLPRGVGLALGDQAASFVALREEVVVFGRLDLGLEVEGVGAEKDAIQVAVREADGAAAGRVEAHGFQE